MGSFRPPRNSFTPEELEVLDLAFHVAWAKLSAGVRGPSQTRAIQDVLSRKIVEIAKAGAVDPGVISALALDQMSPLNATFETCKSRPN